MNPKKILLILIAAFFAISLVSTSALAGSKQRYRWQGVAIGVGAAILGHAIYEAHRQAEPPRVVYAAPPEPPVRYEYGPPHRHGHWEWQRRWVPPLFESVWNPGHYSRNGCWVAGHWMEVKTRDGYWSEERIWVADNRDHHHR